MEGFRNLGRPVVGAHYCPHCGDAANVWLDVVADEIRYVCRRGHRGPWVQNEMSGRKPEWDWPDPDTLMRKPRERY